AVLGIGFLALHFMFMRFFFLNPEIWKDQKNPPPFKPEDLFKVLIWFYLIGAVFFLACAVLNLLSGLFLRRRQNRTFSMVVAGINCLHIPFGTILGVMTLLVLGRDSVRKSYNS